jgi:hypothetical protein
MPIRPNARQSGSRTLPILATLALAFLTAVACQEQLTRPDTSVQSETAYSMTNSNAPFRTWHQGFETGTYGWIASAIAGPDGWCGTVDRREGAAAASAGHAYAVVSFGACNAFWTANGFASSGPYSPGAGYPSPWPPSGYVMELDIHLDPQGSPATTFVYAVSFEVFDQGTLRYLFVPVLENNGALYVAGHDVTQAGWYSFRHVFSDDAGNLAVTFELARAHGPVLHTEPATTTAFTGEPVSSFETANVGAGYVWFVDIAPGLELAIDQHQVRRGR